MLRIRGAGGKEVPLAMIRKRHAPLGGGPALGGTLAPVLLVHGFGQNRYAWHLPARQLSNYLARAGFDVFNLDLRGHGRSRHLGAHRPTPRGRLRPRGHPRRRRGGAAPLRRAAGVLRRPLAGRAHRLRGRAGALAGALAGVATLGSPYHFTRGSWPLGAARAASCCAVDRRVPLGQRAAAAQAARRGDARPPRLHREPALPPAHPRLRRRLDGAHVLGQHMSLAMDTGSLAVLQNLVLGGVESRRTRPPPGRPHPATPAPSRALDVPLLVIAGTKDDLAPPASVQPGVRAQPRARQDLPRLPARAHRPHRRPGRAAHRRGRSSRPG